MKSIADLIKGEKNITDVFVFPSEAAAVDRRREYLNESGFRAVRNDRFLSWDRFKEEITLHDRADKPVNSVLRRIFAADIADRNSRSRIFIRLIPEKYSALSGTFTDTIFRVLPELDRLAVLLDGSVTGFDSALRADYLKLYHEYSTFLRKNNLFEPAWEKPDLQSLKKKYHIICPEIIEDFSEYRDLLDAAGCRFVSSSQEASGVFRQFENSVMETDAVLNEIADLLSKGVHFSEIVITSADDSVTEMLLSGARIRGIPLHNRSGRTLAEHPSGRLPELLRACSTGGYGITAMKNLLMFRAFVWKEADTAAELIRFGIEYRCIKNLSPAPSGDVWAARLKAAGRNRLLAFYLKLKKRIEAFCRSRNFSELSRELQIFVSSFLETDAEIWGEGPEQVFQRVREVLGSICETEQQLVDINISNPLDLWIELLKEKIYVQKRSEPGIAVYPYRVSAVMDPACHFVIGLSHDSSAIVSTAFPFLTDQQRRILGVPENNMSDDFIRIYSLSGKDVRLSCSTETPNGAALSPGVFIESGNIQKYGNAAGIFPLRDPLQAENSWWASACKAGFRIEEAGELPVPGRIRHSGFLYAGDTFMSPNGFDATVSQFPEKETEELILPGMTKNGFFTVSASSLNAWTACPFSLLLSAALKVYENEYVLYAEDPLTAGTVLHEIFCVFFQRIRESGASFSYAEHAEEYQALIRSSASEVFTRWETEENYFFGPAWEAFRRRALQELLLFPGAEAELFEGFSPEMIEEWLSFPVETTGSDDTAIPVKAVGKVDRISAGPDGAVIVDYKKSWKKKRRESFINIGDGGLLPPESGYQLPFYILLAEAAGFKVAASSYYSISDAKHFPVSGRGGVLSDEDVESLCKFTLEEIRRMAEHCRKGDFTAAERCEGCELRSVCRKRFSVRWEQR